jgi:hypothetical protein
MSDGVRVGNSVNASRTYSLVGLLLASVATFGSSTAPASAAPCTENCAPPSGAVLDLSGQPLPVNDPTSYSFAINEADIPSGDAPLTFFFRDDYAYIDLYDVALYDTSSATPNVNLLANGDFSGGVTSGTDIPKGWTYVDPSSESGLFLAGGYNKLCVGEAQCWSDGTSQGYDGLSQSVNWKSGDQYKISFLATVNGVAPPLTPSLLASNATYVRTSTNNGTGFAGNAVDLLAYIGTVQQFAPAPPPPPPLCLGLDCGPIPEPSTWAMMLLGFAGLGFLGYRRAKARAA